MSKNTRVDAATAKHAELLSKQKNEFDALAETRAFGLIYEPSFSLPSVRGDFL